VMTRHDYCAIPCDQAQRSYVPSASFSGKPSAIVRSSARQAIQVMCAGGHHVQKLEDFLGVQVFSRHAGRATLTKAGRTYAVEREPAFGTIVEATRLVAPNLNEDISSSRAVPALPPNGYSRA